jgi:hypothetical protein
MDKRGRFFKPFNRLKARSVGLGMPFSGAFAPLQHLY